MNADKKVFEELSVKSIFGETEREEENDKDELRNMAT